MVRIARGSFADEFNAKGRPPQEGRHPRCRPVDIVERPLSRRSIRPFVEPANAAAFQCPSRTLIEIASA